MEKPFVSPHFTATAYVMHEECILMIFHPKLNKWLPPGGHLEPGETPIDCVQREVLEETGIAIEVISTDPIWIHEKNASSLPTPYLCLLENIPAYQDTPAHQHVDLIYLAKPLSYTPFFGARWVSQEQILDFKEEEEIFKETKQTALHLLQNHTLHAY